MITKRLGILASFILLLVAAFTFLAPSQSKAGMDTITTANDVGGFAWSDTIGWISFSCVDFSKCRTAPIQDPTNGVQYGVDMNILTGDLSGYAWSDNVGWLSFNNSDITQASACGPGTSNAKVNLVTGAVTGYATFLHTSAPPSCVSFSGTSPSYGVTYNFVTKKFSGFAWGGSVAGWISFNQTDFGGSAPAYYVYGPGIGTPPPTPTNVTATAGCDASDIPFVDITWDASAGATSYNVYRYSSPSSTIGIPVATVTTTSYQHTNRAVNSTYYYRVVAVNTSGPSATSSLATATTDDCSNPPPTPTNVSATPGCTANVPYVDISWDASTGATNYRIYQRITGVDTYVTTVTGTTYRHNNRPTMTAHQYRVIASNSAGDSATSTPANATTGACNAPPDTPIDPLAVASCNTSTNTSRVTVSWTASLGATWYTVYRGGSPIATVSTTNYLDTSVSDLTSYTYRVTASNTSGTSTQSVAAPVDTFDCSGGTVNPGPVVNPTATASCVGSGANDGRIVIDFKHPTTGSSPMTFKIFRNNSGSFDITSSADLIRTFDYATEIQPYESPSDIINHVYSYTDNGLARNIQYFYLIVVENGGTPSQSALNATPTDGVSAGCGTSIPGAVTASATGSCSGPAGSRVPTVVLVWSNVANASSYRIYRAGTAGVLGTSGGSSYTDAAVSFSSSYTYSVSGVNSSGVEGPVTIAVPNPVNTLANADCNTVSGDVDIDYFRPPAPVVEGNTCTMTWKMLAVSDPTKTECKVTDPNGNVIQTFSPPSVTVSATPFTAVSPAIFANTTYRLSCYRTDSNPAQDTATALCRVKPRGGEF